ncbi:HAD family hydrolase [Dethiosulfovibrio salsuginis]|uniref:Haloacid dehalogenase superfamily, subfamily IA, variant 3 with third motif having DD or ED n=1 Tax=Dethiosulfovibrio salsuginis TaxID=561720 RepID=A0A1X7JNC0_9BACT|nr:HAD family phosphatase [Dethiosulfovibrio salsuginis]SMG28935.1 haloacid dehalogenase superfamily, subfamily IA, variant 3 with third motif having DD or ED [Dethiosulfovibrio salsuginis]
MTASPMWNPLNSGGFIFDWDGVLADTRLDFSPVREKYFGGKDVPILEEMAKMDEGDRELLSEEIRRLEIDGASLATAVPGGQDLVSLLDDRGIPWSVVSRNCPESIYLAAKTIGFDLPKNTFHRESGHVKPSPEALWMASDAMGVPARSCTVIGDFVYDILGARRAGMRALLVERGPEKWSHWADGHFFRLKELLVSLREGVELVPWEYRSLVQNRGLNWLCSAWEISLEVPSPLAKEDLDLVFKLASLGVGTFIASKEEQPVDIWQEVPWLSSEFLGKPQCAVLEGLLSRRFPMATVQSEGCGVSLELFRSHPELKMEDILR